MTIEWKTNPANPREMLLIFQGEVVRFLPKSLYSKYLKQFRNYLTLNELNAALEQLERRLCTDQAVRLLAFRAHFASELQNKLEAKGYSASAASLAIEECRKLGYLDDLEQTRAVVRREQRKGNGPLLILQKLKMQSGLSADDLGKIKKELCAAQEEGMKVFLQKKCNKCNWKDVLQRRKTMAALQRKGFELEAILKFAAKKSRSE